MIGLILTLIISPITMGYVKMCDRCHQVYPVSSRLDRNHVSTIIDTTAPRAGFKPTESNRKAMLALTWRESNWNPHMQNSRSSSSTLNGFLKSTWKSVGIKKTSCAYCQLEAMWLYVKYRYKTPEKALHFHRRRGYY